MRSIPMKLFWFAFAAQVLGAQVFLWDALPNYQRLTAGAFNPGTAVEYLRGLFGILLMQTGYWVANRLGPLSQIRRNVVLGHVMVCLGEVSLFFINSLAAVILFNDWTNLDFALWKVLVLAASIFAFVCYKRQLTRIGEAMIAGGESTAAAVLP